MARCERRGLKANDQFDSILKMLSDLVSYPAVGNMRNKLVDRLLAGSMLALIVTAPAISIAAPDRVESAVPLPPTLNGQAPSQREATPPPPVGYTPPSALAPETRVIVPAAVQEPD